MAKKKKNKKHRLFWFLVKLQIVLMLVVLAGFLYYNYGGYAKDIQEIRKDAIRLVRESSQTTFIPSQTSILYDTNGQLISYIKGEKEADYVEYEDIPADFTTAMVSIEDKRFYQHDGIDFAALIRSAKAVLESGTLSQGGSTITMQLARNIYLDNGKRWERKIKEIFIAVELEKLYSKNKIMEYYLNNIYFANGYYGIQAACTGYFSCELKDLSLSQIAFLCAIPNSPSRYDPIVNFDNTIARRDRILSNMYEDGKIDEATYLTAIREEIVLQPSQEIKSQRNNYVDTYVYYCATRALMELQGFEFKEYFATEEEKQAYYEEYDELYADCQKQIYAEGYKIYTSIDLNKQEALQNSLNTALSGFADVGENGAYEMQGAAVCIDNETGYVVAIVGGREQNELGIYTLNRAYQSHRQPGSSIKPLIVYTPFFERGNTPDTVVVDEAIEGGPNMSYYYGEVTTRFAVEQSLNPTAWKIYSQITPEAGLQYLKNMHFKEIRPTDYGLATSIGGFTRGTSALEMASAYATLENDGIYRMPTCIKKIVDDAENVVYVSNQEGTKIYKETAARMMTDVLHSTANVGNEDMDGLIGMPCAGKTGTTNGNKDGWFVGYTRYYTTSVWVGCDMPKEVVGLYGASYPTQIWKDYMSGIHQGLTPMNFLPYAQLSPEFMEQYYPPESESEEPVEGENQEEEDILEEESPVEGTPEENEETPEEVLEEEQGM
ncbi:MAG: transglycosylase domain-containing protein [Agathobacter sp.]|nr:transglycosylase domain-containing protein [Agathobacter sp.]